MTPAFVPPPLPDNCNGCGHYVREDHRSMIVTCDTCKNKMKRMNLISCVVFPTLLLLQIILSYLDSWIQKWILNITGIYIPCRVNENNVIVICHCYMSLSFQWCQTVVYLSADLYFNLTIKGLKPALIITIFMVGSHLTSDGLRRPNT
jgi:hypothetical protein